MKTHKKNRIRKILKGGNDNNNNKYVKKQKTFDFLEKQVNLLDKVLLFLENIKIPFSSGSNDILIHLKTKKIKYSKHKEYLYKLLEKLKETKKNILKRTNPTKIKYRLKKFFGISSSKLKLAANKQILNNTQRVLDLYNYDELKKGLFNLLRSSIFIIGQIMSSLIKTYQSILTVQELLTRINTIEDTFIKIEDLYITDESFQSLNDIFNELERLYIDFIKHIITSFYEIFEIDKSETNQKELNISEENANKIYNLLIIINIKIIDDFDEKEKYLKILKKYLEKYSTYLDQEKIKYIEAILQNEYMTATPRLTAMFKDWKGEYSPSTSVSSSPNYEPTTSVSSSPNYEPTTVTLVNNSEI
jgi:hypothetical protein